MFATCRYGLSTETAAAAASQQEEEGEPQQQPPQQQPPQPAAAAAAAANHSPPPPPPPAKRKKKLPEQQQQPQQPQQPQQQEQPAAANIAAAPPEDTWLADYEYGVLQQLFNEHHDFEAVSHGGVSAQQAITSWLSDVHMLSREAVSDAVRFVVGKDAGLHIRMMAALGKLAPLKSSAANNGDWCYGDDDY